MVPLEPPAHNTGCCVIGLTYSSGTFVSFFVFTAGCKASGPPGPPLHPPWNPWNIQLSQGTGQGVSMTFNAASRLEDRSAALGSRRCELPGMHSVPTSAVLPYASGVGGLSRRLLNLYMHAWMHAWTHACVHVCVYGPSKRATGTRRSSRLRGSKRRRCQKRRPPCSASSAENLGVSGTGRLGRGRSKSSVYDLI